CDSVGCLSYLCFFFQAEDGIRDRNVTGVQTCALPILMIGQALSFLNEAEWEGKADFLKKLYRVQTILFHVGAELSTPKDREVAWKLKESHITELEEQIDDWSETLPPITQFI